MEKERIDHSKAGECSGPSDLSKWPKCKDLPLCCVAVKDGERLGRSKGSRATSKYNKGTDHYWKPLMVHPQCQTPCSQEPLNNAGPYVIDEQIKLRDVKALWDGFLGVSKGNLSASSSSLALSHLNTGRGGAQGLLFALDALIC